MSLPKPKIRYSLLFLSPHFLCYLPHKVGFGINLLCLQCVVATEKLSKSLCWCGNSLASCDAFFFKLLYELEMLRERMIVTNELADYYSASYYVISSQSERIDPSSSRRWFRRLKVITLPRNLVVYEWCPYSLNRMVLIMLAPAKASVVPLRMALFRILLLM